MAEMENGGLRATEDHFRLLAESSRDMISRTDTRGVCTYASPACRDVLGYEPEEIVGTSLFELAHPDEATRNRALFERAIATGELVGRPFATRMRHKNGSYVWIESTSKLLYDDGGRIVAVQATGRDVSERVAAQEALAESQKSFRMLIDRMPNAVVVHRHKHVIHANPSFARLIGYETAESLVGRNVLDFVEAEQRAEIRSRLEAVHRVHTGMGEHRLIRADGGRVAVKVTALPVVMDGELADMAIAEDLTEHKALEAELLNADRMAALGRLAAAVGHEINNPLAYVRGNLDIVRAKLTALGPDVVPLLERLAIIEEGVERVRAIVADLRHFSAVHEGELGAVDPARAIACAVATASHEIRMRARVERELRADGHVRAEERRLVQVLVNLLVNAAQAIPEGHVDENEIRVLTRDEEDGNTVSIEVWDTGIGLPEGDVSRLFEPFFTTRGELAGTGLGLSTSHRIITSFGGSLHAARRPDRGSIFRLSLPRTTPEKAAEIADPCARHETRQLRVLVVEDERALAETVRMLLEPHVVVVEHSGAAAIERLAKEAVFDLVLCDLQMPSGSGAELYEHARRTSPGFEQRFIFMTGGVFTEQARVFLRSCSQPVLEKPFTSDELHNAIALTVKRNA